LTASSECGRKRAVVALRFTARATPCRSRA
jgi:hypothetical protein